MPNMSVAKEQFALKFQRTFGTKSIAPSSAHGGRRNFSAPTSDKKISAQQEKSLQIINSHALIFNSVDKTRTQRTQTVHDRHLRAVAPSGRALC